MAKKLLIRFAPLTPGADPALVDWMRIGEDGKAPGVHGLTISGNLMCHAGGGLAIDQNPETNVTGAAILGNRLSGFTRPDGIAGTVRREGNIAGLAACS